MLSLEKHMNKLIEHCEEYICGEEKTVDLRCAPYRPVLFMSFGICCEEERMNSVKKVIGDGWNHYKDHLHIMQYASPDELKTWKEDLVDAILRIKMVKMGTFQVYNEIILVIYLNTSDENYELYLDAIKEIKSEHDECMILISLMISEKSKKEKAGLPDKLQVICQLKEDNMIQGLLLLSNQLKDGRILTNTEEVDNYNISANIIYMSNSCNVSNGIMFEASKELEQSLWNDSHAVTVSYVGIHKPVNEIAYATLKGMMDAHIDYEERWLQDHAQEISAYRFGQKLLSLGFDRIFEEELMPVFPTKEDLIYIPDLDEYETLVHCENESELAQLLSQSRYAFWNLFEQKYYADSVTEFFKDRDEELSEYLKTQILTHIFYPELLQVMLNQEIRQELYENFECIQNTELLRMKDYDGIPEKLYYIGIYRAKKEFSARMKRYVITILEECTTEAENYRSMLSDISWYLDTNCENTPIYRYYMNLMRQLYPYEKYRESMCLVRTDPESVCKNMQDIYEAYTKEYRHIYHRNFEEELNQRSGSEIANILSMMDFNNTVHLANQCRFDYGGVPDGKTYSMVYENAAFVKDLKAMNEKERIFFTSHQDSASRFMICNFDLTKISQGSINT